MLLELEGFKEGKMNRSQLMKSIWRKRKREGGKATCSFCGRAIFAGGVRMKGKPYHKGCSEFAGAGLMPAQVGLNPRRKRGRIPRDGFRYFGAEPLDNPRYSFGPTGFRPPARWWSKMAESAAASYFGKKLKKLTKGQKERVSTIVGGIWAKFSDATRRAILREYEPSATRANPKLRNIHQLPCPICKNPIAVNRANVSVICPKCKTSLISRRITRRK